MRKDKLSLFTTGVKQTFKRHSPAIMTGIGIAGMGTSVVLAAKATPKVLTMLKDAEYEKQEELTNTEKFKVAWKPYLPATLTFVGSAACLVGANSVHIRRNAALATACKLSESALVEYRDKVVETIGEKKEKEVRNEIAKDKVTKQPVANSTIFDTGKGATLCFDPLSARYFKCDPDTIKRAENTINKQILHDISGYSSVNEFYDEIGLEHTSIGYEIGWNAYHLMDIDFSSTLTEENKPVAVINYINKPKYGYERF